MESDAHKTSTKGTTGQHPRASSNESWDAEAQDNNINIVPLTRDQAEKLFGPEVSHPPRITSFKVVAAQWYFVPGCDTAVWLFYKPPGGEMLRCLPYW